MPTETERFEAQGSNALATLKAALSGFDFDESEVVRAAVEVDIETPEPEMNGGSSNGSNGKSGRELKQLQRNTNQHYALFLLATEADTPIEPKKLVEYDDADLHGRDQLANALRAVYDRMLADREKVSGKYGFRYTVNDHGVAELDRLGKPDFDQYE